MVRKTMVLSTEWAQVEVVELTNDGNGLGFNLVGGRSTGVVIKYVLPGGIADKDGRLQSGDHVLQVGSVNLRGFTSEQVAAVLRQAGPTVRLLVARPADPAAALRAPIPGTALVPTKLLADPELLDRHLIEAGYGAVYDLSQCYSEYINGQNGDVENLVAAVSIIAMWVPNLPVTVLTGVAAGAGLLCIFKDVHGGVAFDKNVLAEGKTVIVTGATSGIGKEAVWEFAKRGAKVFMACRDMEKCEEVRREIVLETRNKYVYCRPCDLASTASVRGFVARFKAEEPELNILVNNAGVMETPKGVTKDGFEVQLGTNHFGHFLLTELLLDTLKASTPSRVIVVTCSAHQKGTINKEDLNLTSKYDPVAAYNQSKLANVLFARELGRQMLDTGVAVTAVDPGFTDTDLTRNLAMMKSITRFFVYPIFWPVMKKPRTGAQVILHAALDPDLDKSAGDYYVDMKKVQPSEKAQDYELAQWLWKVSEKWTKVAEHKAELAKAQSA